MAGPRKPVTSISASSGIMVDHLKITISKRPVEFYRHAELKHTSSLVELSHAVLDANAAQHKRLLHLVLQAEGAPNKLKCFLGWP